MLTVPRQRSALAQPGPGNRVYALEGGPMPGFHFSNALEFLDVAPAAKRPARRR